ncbi:NO-inducible flavohemoprotein [Motilimonas cestriensis]|uniref:nitric oxide dioxygenase n=1 Tax=Motilimonas cestriensis TaxID=2742685 RepID=A0ABS8WB95_9GAMM|nr:NO-inducible flavohemoprotein [Motilimonas cestriensis]MCE2595054.1 NO-inducible flavohemoprotein [Motilimonas cestriensis]
MLSQQTVERVKSTAPFLTSHGPALTAHFYQRLFKNYPDLQHTFNRANQASGRQQLALFSAIGAYVHYLDDLPALTSAVERIAQKHSSVLVQAEHYEVVGQELIGTLGDLGGELITPDIQQAWIEAYQFLANIFITREQAIYTAQANKVGGWQGFRRFIIHDKIMESELIQSFILMPEDGAPVADFLPGQYIGIQLRAAGQDYDAIRQYSLSDTSNSEYYRISVKCEHDGEVSPYLHQLPLQSIINVTPPSGDFYLNLPLQTPIVLLSGGIGQTPLLSMLNSTLKQPLSKDIYYLHGCENGQHHAFAKHLNFQCKAHPKLHRWVWYQSPLANDLKSEDYDFSGLMSLDKVASELPIEQAHFYCCGPTGFMAEMYRQLTSMGVTPDRIHYENFGPHIDANN